MKIHRKEHNLMTKAQFEQEVIALIDVLHSVSYSVLQNPDDQADAVQSCVLKALHKRESLRQPQFLRTWLIRILLNECYDILRQRKRLLPSEAVQAVVPPQADPSLNTALNALEPRFRLPIVLHHIAGYSTREVAQILRVPEGTVKGRLVRGRAYLKAILQKEET